jgi:hypothetical protein
MPGSSTAAVASSVGIVFLGSASVFIRCPPSCSGQPRWTRAARRVARARDPKGRAHGDAVQTQCRRQAPRLVSSGLKRKHLYGNDEPQPLHVITQADGDVVIQCCSGGCYCTRGEAARDVIRHDRLLLVQAVVEARLRPGDCCKACLSGRRVLVVFV